jgi:hypothetical protein
MHGERHENGQHKMRMTLRESHKNGLHNHDSGEGDWHRYLTFGERHENGEHNHRSSTPVVSCEERGWHEMRMTCGERHENKRDNHKSGEDVDLHEMRLTLGERHENDSTTTGVLLLWCLVKEEDGAKYT